MKRSLYAMIVAAAIVLAQACEPPKQPPPMPQEEFIDLYVKARLIRAQADSVSAKMQVDSLLLHRGLTADSMQTVIAWYQRNPERWVNLYRQISNAFKDSLNAAR